MSEFHSERTQWRKSSYSGLENDCIEVADGFPGTVPVRDSKNPDGPVVTVPAQIWTSFVDAVKSGRLHG